MRLLAISSASLIVLALAAAPAAAQGRVDLQLNLSTQPVYGGYRSPSPNYFGSGDLYTTGNVRAGRALMINRTFLEDRFFAGSLTRFFRDTVSANELTSPGYSYAQIGSGAAFYQPGSLVNSGATVGMRPITGGAPFGLNYNPSTSLPSPFSTRYEVRTEPLEPTLGQYPTMTAMRGLLFQMPADVLPPTMAQQQAAAALRWQKEEEPLLPVLPMLTTTEKLLAPPSTVEPGPGGVAPGQPQEPWTVVPEPTEEGAEVQGVRPMEFLRNQYNPQAQPPQPPIGQTLGLNEELGNPEQMQAEEPSIEMPQSRVTRAGRPARLYDQYMTMAREELKAGAYRPAADAFGRAADFNPLDPWEAVYGEGVAHLLTRQYYLASYQLNLSMERRPDTFGADLRLGGIVDRPEDWNTVEKDLRATMTASPGAADPAFCLAWVLVFSGRGDLAGPYLTVAEKDPDYAASIKLMRQRITP